MNNTNEWPVPKNRILLGLFINLMLLSVGAFSQFIYMGKVGYWGTQIEQKSELIVFGTQITSLYFAWVALIPGLLIVNIHLLFKDILKREIPGLFLKVQNFLGGVLFLGIFLILTGSLFINPLWEDRFREAGFVECEGSVLNFRKAVFNDVWVRNPENCQDSRLRWILQKHFDDEGFELASQYLKELNSLPRDR